MSQHRCATCLIPLERQRQRAGEILCPACEAEWLRQLCLAPGTSAPHQGHPRTPPLPSPPGQHP